MFPSAEAREKAITEYAASVKGWDLVLGIAICAVVGIGSLVLARLLLFNAMPKLVPWVPPIARELLMFAVVGGCMFFTIRVLHRWGVRRDMRQRLLAAGVPVCVSCGYLLRALPPGTRSCPECGREIDQKVRAMLITNVTE